MVKSFSPRTTAWMQEVEQRMEQLPRHEEHEGLKSNAFLTMHPILNIAIDRLWMSSSIQVIEVCGH